MWPLEYTNLREIPQSLKKLKLVISQKNSNLGRLIGLYHADEYNWKLLHPKDKL